MDIREKAGAVADGAKEGAEEAATQVRQSRAYQVLVTAGLIAYGVIHLLIGWIIARLALGDGSGEASSKGALAELQAIPGGTVALWFVAVGLLALVVWQAVAAVIGYRECDTAKRRGKRIGSVARAVVFAGLASSAAFAALGMRGSAAGEQEENAARSLLDLPGGQMLVALLGVAVIGYGGYQVFAGITARFNDELTTRLSGAGRMFATAGYIAKGVAVAMIGVLFIVAAVRYDAKQAGGMGQGLAALREQPFGVPLLLVLAVGIGCFGIWCFYYSRHAKHA